MILLKRTVKIRELCDEIKKKQSSFPNCREVYLFGSFLTKNNPNDIDVLVVYDDSECDVTVQLDGIEKLIENISLYPVDMTALSVDEMNETFFLEKINFKYIRII